MPDQLMIEAAISEASVLVRRSSSSGFWLCVAACSLFLASAVNTTTIWIDEGYSAWVAGHQSFGSALQTLLAGDSSDKQMPLHYLWLWVWTRVFGSSEYALRSANIPFTLLFVVALALTSRYLFGRRFAWIPLALSPFAWFYVNEARAYFTLLAFSTAAVGALLTWAFGPETSRKPAGWLLFLCFLLSAATHMLTALLLPAVAIIGYRVWRRRGAEVWRELWAPACIFVIPFAALGFFYASTLSRPANYDYGPPSMAHFGAAVYEHAGFGGLGPPRNNLRRATIETFTPYLQWLIPGVIGLLFVCRKALTRISDPILNTLIPAWVLSFVFTIVSAYIVHSRFLGRHISALLPLLLFSVLATAPSLRECIVLGMVWVASDLRLAFLPQYYKDDYRGAVEDVIDRVHSKPGLIAWAADPLAANYYGLMLDDPLQHAGYLIDYSQAMAKVSWPERGRGVIVELWDRNAVRALLSEQRQLGRPVYLALSKPDIYDEDRNWQLAVAEWNGRKVAEYRAFSVFEIAGR